MAAIEQCEPKVWEDCDVDEKLRRLRKQVDLWVECDVEEKIRQIREQIALIEKAHNAVCAIVTHNRDLFDQHEHLPTGEAALAARDV